MILVGALLVLLVAGGAAAAASSSSGGKLEYRENLAGVHPAIVWLCDKWNAEGTHVIGVAPAGTDWEYPGGLRTDPSIQAQADAGGLSNASTLQQTPHGRGGAVDVWPKGFNPRLGFNDAGQLPGAELLMRAFGEWAEQQQHPDGWRYRWGGRFSNPDLPHVELADWTQLPFPPPEYATP